jgi:hypothetical protein
VKSDGEALDDWEAVDVLKQAAADASAEESWADYWPHVLSAVNAQGVKLVWDGDQ